MSKVWSEFWWFLMLIVVGWVTGFVARGRGEEFILPLAKFLPFTCGGFWAGAGFRRYVDAKKAKE